MQDYTWITTVFEKATKLKAYLLMCTRRSGCSRSDIQDADCSARASHRKMHGRLSSACACRSRSSGPGTRDSSQSVPASTQMETTWTSPILVALSTGIHCSRTETIQLQPSDRLMSSFSSTTTWQSTDDSVTNNLLHQLCSREIICLCSYKDTRLSRFAAM